MPLLPSQAPADFIIEMLDAPAQPALGGDCVDRALKRHIRHPVAFLEFKGKPVAASWTFPRRSVFILGVVAAMNALHGGPPGRLPRPSINTRSQASSMASVHSLSPMRRRRVSFGSFRP